MKKIIGFILLLTISFNSFSQANEEDINALSIFSEYVKAKNYDADTSRGKKKKYATKDEERYINNPR